MAQQSNRHHYIPCFYSKRWTGTDGRLCQYSRPYGQVVPNRKAPKAVGFESELYSLEGVHPDDRNLLEDHLFKITDQLASDAVDYMLSNMTTRLSPPLRSALARLITTFFHRSPQRYRNMKRYYETEMETHLERLRQRHLAGEDIILGDAFTFDEVASNWREKMSGPQWGNFVQGIMDSAFLGDKIANMIWGVRKLKPLNLNFLTSDVPLLNLNGLAHADSFLILPLSPIEVLIATNNLNTMNDVLGRTDNRLVRLVNENIVRQANNYIFGLDDTHLRFIKRHWPNPSL